MRCLCCNSILSSFESTRRYEDGSFVDKCNHCFKGSDYKGKVKERRDLLGLAEEEIIQELVPYESSSQT